MTALLLFTVVEAFMLVMALTADTIVSGFAYGAKKIKIPFTSATIISVVCSAILAVSLFLGRFIGGILPSGLASAICFAVLLILGISKIFDSGIKNIIRKHNGLNKKVEFSAFNLGFILNIYANPEEADKDRSNALSPIEALSLAVALSLDGLAVGLGAGMSSVNTLIVVVLSLIINMAGIMFGSFVGNRIARKIRFDLSWLSGALLILLAVMKLT